MHYSRPHRSEYLRKFVRNCFVVILITASCFDGERKQSKDTFTGWTGKLSIDSFSERNLYTATRRRREWSYLCTKEVRATCTWCLYMRICMSMIIISPRLLGHWLLVRGHQRKFSWHAQLPHTKKGENTTYISCYPQRASKTNSCRCCSSQRSRLSFDRLATGTSNYIYRKISSALSR